MIQLFLQWLVLLTHCAHVHHGSACMSPFDIVLLIAVSALKTNRYEPISTRSSDRQGNECVRVHRTCPKYSCLVIVRLCDPMSTVNVPRHELSINQYSINIPITQVF